MLLDERQLMFQLIIRSLIFDNHCYTLYLLAKSGKGSPSPVAASLYFLYKASEERKPRQSDNVIVASMLIE